MTELFLPRWSLVSDIPAGDGKLVNLFLRCSGRFLHFGQLTMFCCIMSQIVTIITLNFNEMITTIFLMYVCLSYNVHMITFLGKLNRGRGMMPGIGYIGGRLSIVGGYSWPGAVDLIEEWDEDRYIVYSGIQNLIRIQRSDPRFRSVSSLQMKGR
jgi:hypothetical protein